jgi:hypothetical protein
MPTSNTRQQKGQELAQLHGSVIRIDEHTYKVKSQIGSDKQYDVMRAKLVSNEHVLTKDLGARNASIFSQ